MLFDAGAAVPSRAVPCREGSVENAVPRSYGNATVVTKVSPVLSYLGCFLSLLVGKYVVRCRPRVMINLLIWD